MAAYTEEARTPGAPLEAGILTFKRITCSMFVTCKFCIRSEGSALPGVRLMISRRVLRAQWCAGGGDLKLCTPRHVNHFVELAVNGTVTMVSWKLLTITTGLLCLTGCCTRESN